MIPYAKPPIFNLAAKYASHGIELLQSSKWQENRSLTLKLYTLSAEMELILGNIAVAERRNGEVLDRDDVSAMEKLPLKLAKARTLSSVELKFGEAIDYCVDLLKELGVNLCWSRRLVPVQALKKALSTIKKVKQFPKESYKKGGIMEDPKQKAIVRLLARITYLGLNVDMSLALLCALRLIDMTMQQGVHEASGTSLATLGIFVIALQQDFEGASKIAKTALYLAENFGRMRNGETIILAYAYILTWQEPIASCEDPSQSGYLQCLRVGDLEYALWNLLSIHFIQYMRGMPLDFLLAESKKLMVQFEEASQSLHILTLRVIQQMILNIHNHSLEDSPALQGAVFSKAREGKADAHNIVNMILAEGEIQFFHGCYGVPAERALKIGDEFMKFAGSYFLAMIECFHRGVALYAMALTTKQRKYKVGAKKVRRMIAKWEKKGNPNVKYYNTLLNAEHAALGQKYDEADSLYKDAIVSVTAVNHLHHAGLVHERYAAFLERDRRMKDESKILLKESIRYYKEWGARAIVEALESRL